MKRHHRLAQKAPASTCPARRRLGGLYAPELLEARIAPATFIVTSLLDNGTAGTLREEILAANTAPGADTIVFKLADPLLPHTIVLNTVTGEIPISGPLTIKGPGIDLLSISGSDLIRIFSIFDGSAATLSPTTISGLTLTDGRTAGDGGALNSAEPLTLKNVVIRGSYAGADGGGVFVKTAGKISITSSRIVHNEASDDSGGLYLRADAGITIVKTTIADNTGLTRGGLYARADGAKSVILIDTCVIANNTATSGSGGGLMLFGEVNGKIILKNSLITGNTSITGGGGLFVNEGNLSLTNTTVSNNSSRFGGGAFIDSITSVSITSSRFVGNSATDGAGMGGGALFVEGLVTNSPGTVVKIAGSSFLHNVSANDGGVFAHTDKVVLNISGSSFLGNTAVSDGGVFAFGEKLLLAMKSSTLSGNSAGSTGGVIFAQTNTGLLFPVTPTVLTLSGNKFTENRAMKGGALMLEGIGVSASTAVLSGNLFQANFAAGSGGAVYARQDSTFTSKGDRFIGNVATGQGGGVYLINTGGTILTSALIQSNVAGSSGGGAVILGTATLTSLKVLDNIAGAGGNGGGLRLAGAVVLSKSTVTGNVANNGGGIFFNVGTATIDAATMAKTKGNAALINQNIGSA